MLLCCAAQVALAPPGSTHRLPIAHMVCNQSPPVGDKPSLMSHREVETLFHEFGPWLPWALNPGLQPGPCSSIPTYQPSGNIRSLTLRSYPAILESRAL